MAPPARRPATYEDLLALPEHVVGEIVDGELHVSPTPPPRCSLATTTLIGELGPALRRDRDTAHGWVLLYAPELHLGRDVVVADLVAWRRARMPEVPLDQPYLVLAPDWACEVLSPSTAALDRTKKLAFYARERVGHVWLVDPIAQTLEVLRLDGDTYRIAMTAAADAVVRAEPFDAIELSLARLWAR